MPGESPPEVMTAIFFLTVIVDGRFANEAVVEYPMPRKRACQMRRKKRRKVNKMSMGPGKKSR
jgi:hypothetical protein